MIPANHYRRRHKRWLTPTGDVVVTFAAALAIVAAGMCGRWLQMLVEWLA